MSQGALAFAWFNGLLSRQGEVGHWNAGAVDGDYAGVEFKVGSVGTVCR